jgi:hypothetical protein
MNIKKRKPLNKMIKRKRKLIPFWLLIIKYSTYIYVNPQTCAENFFQYRILGTK